jgi:hypothetical protein
LERRLSGRLRARERKIARKIGIGRGTSVRCFVPARGRGDECNTNHTSANDPRARHFRNECHPERSEGSDSIDRSFVAALLRTIAYGDLHGISGSSDRQFDVL